MWLGGTRTTALSDLSGSRTDEVPRSESAWAFMSTGTLIRRFARRWLLLRAPHRPRPHISRWFRSPTKACDVPGVTRPDPHSRSAPVCGCEVTQSSFESDGDSLRSSAPTVIRRDAHVTRLTGGGRPNSAPSHRLGECHTPPRGWDVNVTPIKRCESRIETENRRSALTGGKRRNAYADLEDGTAGGLVDLLQQADQMAARDPQLQGGAASIPAVP